MKNWAEIIQQALSNVIESTNKAVPGAKLRSEVAKVATENGVEFPPEGMQRFSSFVESFDKHFIVLRRPGSDVLVAPAERPELLADAGPEVRFGYSRMRQDVFEALTTIPVSEKGVPFYRPEFDSVLWIKGEATAPKDAVEFPATALEEEIALRNEFCNQVDAGGAAKNDIAEALASKTPLRSFTEVVQSYGLNKQWHIFRLRSLATKLRDWSVSMAVQWQPSWVNISEPKAMATNSVVLQTATSRYQFAEMATRLSDEDFSRISVPLDVVLRLLSQR